MIFLKKTIPLAFASLLLLSCQSNNAKKVAQGSYYTPKYANGFCIDTVNGKKILRVYNPFQSSQQVSYRYAIDSAVQRVVCMSTTHAALLSFIGQAQSMVGLAGASLAYDSALRERYAANLLADVGYDTQLNMERVLALQPNVIFAYGISGEFTSVANKLTELGLRVVYLGEYTEEHPLGKAEWAVAVASFFGCEAAAVAKFAQVEREYLQLKELSETTTEKVKVLLNAPWSEAWFVPGRRGYMATLLHDAISESAIALRNRRDSYPLSIERAYRDAQLATIWLNPGQAGNLHELKAMHKLIENIPVFAQGEVYNNNARLNAQGGNDFFESGTVSPHIILKDLIKIMHPDLLPQHELFYYRKLE